MEETKQDTQGLESPLCFTIHMLPWENAPVEEPLLSRILRENSEGSGKRRGKEKALENGLRVVMSYRLRRGDFFFEKKSGGRILQRSEQEPYGWSVTKWDYNGNVTEKIRFSPELLWLQSAYFKDGNIKEPVVFLLPHKDGLEYLERTEEGWRKSFLLLRPAESGAKGSLLKNRAGDPVCSVWSSRGMLWAYRPEESRACKETEEKLIKGEIQEEPQWPGEKQKLFSEERLPELERFLAPEEETGRKEEGHAVSAGANDYAADHSLQDFAEPTGGISAAVVSEPATKYAVAARSLSGVVSAPGIPQKREEEEKDTVSEEQETSKTLEEPMESREPSDNGKMAPLEGVPEQDTDGLKEEKNENSLKEPMEEETPETPELRPKPETVSGSENAGKKEDFLPEGMEEFREFFQQVPDKLVTGADGQLYAYYGGMKGSLRHGDGRTAMENGHTAYEGGFREDKKDGFGVYYYKSGRLCYAGNWKGNRRQGAGVSFSPQEGTMFAGKWRENRPDGMGALFDEDGELLYAGQWKNGKRHGKGTEYRRGEVVFSGLWENGEPVVNGAGGGR